MKRLLMTLAIGMSLFGLSHVGAQAPGDPGSFECRAAQRDVQNGVDSGGPYGNHGQLVLSAARQIDAAEEAWKITKECAACILAQFARGVPIAQQEPCGPDPACGDRLCSAGENLYSCPDDCGGSTLLGHSTRIVSLTDSCTAARRACDSVAGDLATDALRTTYVVDFAIVNAGALRDDLTCPLPDHPADFCPSYVPPPYPITRGQVLDALPFRDVVVTLSVNGTELATILENGVAAAFTDVSRFPEVSGLCLTYNVEAPLGHRVSEVVRQSEDGSCQGVSIDLTSASTYTIAETDFMVGGGDGYPNLASRALIRDIADQVVADYIRANTPIDPPVPGRIRCTDARGQDCVPCGDGYCPSPNYCAQCLYGFMCLREGEGCI